MIKVFYFAHIRESLGVASESLELDPSVSDVGGLIAWLCRRGGVWPETLGGRRPVLVAVNQKFANGATRVRDRDEVALFPPVTGG